MFFFRLQFRSQIKAKQNLSTKIHYEKNLQIRLKRIELINKIKRAYRKYKCQQHFKLLKYSAIRIQCRFRVFRAKEKLKRERNRNFYGPDVCYIFIKNVIISGFRMELKMTHCNGNYKIICYRKIDYKMTEYYNNCASKSSKEELEKTGINSLTDYMKKKRDGNKMKTKIVIELESYFYKPEIKILINASNNLILHQNEKKKTEIKKINDNDKTEINRSINTNYTILDDISTNNKNSLRSNDKIEMIQEWQHQKVAELILKNMEIVKSIPVCTNNLQNKNEKFHKKEIIDTSILRNCTFVLKLPPCGATQLATTSFSSELPSSINPSLLPRKLNLDTDSDSNFSVQNLNFGILPSITELAILPKRRLLNDQKGLINSLNRKEKFKNGTLKKEFSYLGGGVNKNICDNVTGKNLNKISDKKSDRNLNLFDTKNNNDEYENLKYTNYGESKGKNRLSSFFSQSEKYSLDVLPVRGKSTIEIITKNKK